MATTHCSVSMKRRKLIAVWITVAILVLIAGSGLGVMYVFQMRHIRNRSAAKAAVLEMFGNGPVEIAMGKFAAHPAGYFDYLVVGKVGKPPSDYRVMLRRGVIMAVIIGPDEKPTHWYKHPQYKNPKWNGR